MKTLTALFLFVLVLSVSVFGQLPAPSTERVQFLGDSDTKLMYSLGCTRISDIKPKRSVRISSIEDGKKKGFVLSGLCGKAEPEEIAGIATVQEIAADPKNFLNKTVQVTGNISLAKLPIDLEGEQSRLRFHIFNGDKAISVYFKNDSREGAVFADLLVDSSPNGIMPGKFTLVIRKLRKDNRVYAELLSYSLSKRKK